MTDDESEIRDTFTANDARAKLADPTYAGMGPFSAIVDDETWLSVNMIRNGREGAETVVDSILDQFKEVFSGLPVPDAEPYIQQAKTDPWIALRRLLTDLRNIAEEKRV